jgi:ATP-binding protein involved in chromosome partitioning
MTESNILKALSSVQEPDLKRDLVSLGMVQNLTINESTVSFTIILTTPACPLKEKMRQDATKAIQELYPGASVNIDFIANTTSLRSDVKTALPGVKNIIAVVSGKGGVGKSTVSSNLALALAKKGASVGLMDADIYGPSLPIMFGVRGQRPQIKDVDGKGKIVPLVQYGIKLMSIGLLVDEKNAVVWRGPMASSAIRQFVSDVLWEDLDYLVIDMPPGTGDIHLTLLQSVPVTGAIVVTTPQEVALADAKKAIAMFGQAQINVPIIGIVENMAWFTPAELPSNRYYIFGKDGGKNLAEEYDIYFLGQIPIVQEIRQGGDSGAPVLLDNEPISAEAFDDFADRTIRQIAVANAKFKKEKTPEAVS